MKKIERIELISNVGKELQQRMTFDDIESYLSSFGVNTENFNGSWDSKWQYAKAMLRTVTQDTLLTIAEELGLDNPQQSIESKIAGTWKVNHFRLFISHLSEHKLTAANLQTVLLSYGISGFVAHEDIAPTTEWQSEIETSLLTMDALVAILTPKFHESDWTDHEIGAAIGRNKYIIPIDKGLKPYGFIGKYQAVPTKGKNVGQVANALFKLLISHVTTKYRITESLVYLASSSSSLERFNHYFQLLIMIDTPASDLIGLFISNIGKLDYIFSDDPTLKKVNDYLLSLGSEPLVNSTQKIENLSDKIPF